MTIIYGVWVEGAWGELANGEIFRMPYLALAKAQCAAWEVWQHDANLPSPQVAIIDENGGPEFIVKAKFDDQGETWKMSLQRCEPD